MLFRSPPVWITLLVLRTGFTYERFLAFVTYDYFITLDEEVKLFWNRKLSVASALFLINRYLVLILRLCNLIGFAPMPDHVRRFLCLLSFDTTSKMALPVTEVARSRIASEALLRLLL